LPIASQDPEQAIGHLLAGMMYTDGLAQLDPQEATEKRSDTILIIDDDDSQVEVLSIHLSLLGYTVLSSTHGENGVSLAREKRPNLILLDLRLPDTSGFDVCEQLSDEPQTCGIPVIIVSGMEHSNIVRQARAAGSQYFVRKPYDPNALLVLIRDALGTV